MTIVGKDGKPIDISKASLIGENIRKYKVGEIEIQTNETPGQVLLKAQQTAVGLLQQQGQFSAAKNANPFVFEPAALGVFMLLCDEIKRLEGQIQELKGIENGEQIIGKSEIEINQD